MLPVHFSVPHCTTWVTALTGRQLEETKAGLRQALVDRCICPASGRRTRHLPRGDSGIDPGRRATAPGADPTRPELTAAVKTARGDSLAGEAREMTAMTRGESSQRRSGACPTRTRGDCGGTQGRLVVVRGATVDWDSEPALTIGANNCLAKAVVGLGSETY